MQASAALLRMIEEVSLHLDEIDLFVADRGPGSFIGVRVGVTLAKSLAWSVGRPCASISAFDLIAPDAVVAFPSKRGEYFVRVPGEPVIIAEKPPHGATGFGPHFANQVLPDPAQAKDLLNRLVPVEPAALLPDYVYEPSISTPKTPYAQA